MRVRFALLPCAGICAASVFGLPLRADAPSRSIRFVAPGVTLTQEVVSELSPEGPLTVSVLQVEPGKKALLRAALGQDTVWSDDPTFGRETVSRYVSRHPEVVAAINAGFFPFAGNPIGLHVEDGELVTEATLNRSVFCILKNGKARIERFTFSGSASASGNRIALDGLNRRPGKASELLLFTPRFGPATLPAPGRVEVALSRIGKIGPQQTVVGKVVQIADDGALPLAPGAVVLSAGGAKADTLRRLARLGAKVTVQVDTRTASGAPFPVRDIREAVCGAARLVSGGREAVNVAEEGMAATFSTTRHPRTAVGITRNGTLLLMVVDGRQKTVSRGASLPELARLMLKWNAADAVNLDGGGSSALVVRGVVVNAPSDGRERPVADLLTVTAAAATPGKGDPTPVFSRPTRPLRVGETWTLVSPVQKLKGLWGLPGNQPIAGWVSQTGVFYAVRPGSGSVSYLPPSGKGISVPITVVPAPAPSPTPTAPAAAAPTRSAAVRTTTLPPPPP